MDVGMLTRLLWLCWFFSGAHGDIFTATVDMEELLVTESVLVNTLQQYIAATEARLARLRHHLGVYKKEHQAASRGVEEYISNPINTYQLTKRLTTDWNEVKYLLKNSAEQKFMKNMTNYKFPTNEDLNGAAVALFRLQDTYKLDTSSMANGILNGVQYNSKLASGDCFELGRQSFRNNDYYHSVLWMTEAMKRHKGKTKNSIAIRRMMEYLAYSIYKQGNTRKALQITNEILEIHPGNVAALTNKLSFEKAIEESTENESTAGGDETYKKLCRGEEMLSGEVLAQLKCRYVDMGRPFLKIAPLKEEEAFLEPRIVLYHEMLSDEEMDTIRSLATPRLERSSVQSDGKLKVDYRISKTAWLADEDHKYVAAINNKVADMTGLNTDTAEPLQVVNYGLGGHYLPHFDFFQKDHHQERVATVMFYLSDVAQGGATVFPFIKVALQPRKGTAAVWYNLLPSGVPDFYTFHGGCPVLVGSKWICNKWLIQEGQEFVKPCELIPPTPDEKQQQILIQQFVLGEENDVIV